MKQMYQRTDFKNGLRVITHEMKDRDSISIGFWVDVGGRNEDMGIKGAAHFLEHILFKGSKKYTCDQIKELIEGVGGSLNAFTTEENTCYYAKIPARHLSGTFDILGDMVFAPTVTKKDVDKETNVIIEEIKMYHDLPQYLVYDLLDGIVWPDHPLGVNLAGTVESVSRLSNVELRKFHRQYYAPSNVVVAASGRLKHTPFANMVKRKCGKFLNHTIPEFSPAEKTQTEAKFNFYQKDTEQMHVALGAFAFEDSHPDRYVLSLMNVILGGNMSSRLFNEVREKRGLAYSIHSSYKLLKDTGLFIVRAGVDNKRLVDAIALIHKELNKIQRTGVKDGEFKRAKDYLLGQLLLSMEDTMEHMLWMGNEVINRNKVRTMKEIVSKINAVKPSDIKRLAKQMFQNHMFNLAVVGPLADEQKKELRRVFD